MLRGCVRSGVKFGDRLICDQKMVMDFFAPFGQMGQMGCKNRQCPSDKICHGKCVFVTRENVFWVLVPLMHAVDQSHGPDLVMMSSAEPKQGCARQQGISTSESSLFSLSLLSLFPSPFVHTPPLARWGLCTSREQQREAPQRSKSRKPSFR